MKKVLPFIFPLASLAIVLFLAFRWYNNRTDRGSITPFAENVAIEELSDEDTALALRGVGDYESVDLKGENGNTGKLRYEINDGKVRFSVTADLENSPGTNYQVWLKDPNSEAIRKAFPLEYLKGGMSGTAAISAETLPFEVIVSKDSAGATAPSEILLKGLVKDKAEATE
ncbi:hypothetical protein KJZ63_05260 [Patescibacteria group bacterium]|nr:hypothetical protein [Patescibacteria group bacterium]